MFIPACCVLCLVICMPLYLSWKKENLRLALIFKGLGTLCAFLPAFVAAVRLGGTAWLCAVSIFFCAVADILLEYNVVFGGTFFGLAHIGFIFWSLSRAQVTLLHLICLLLLAGLMAFLIARIRKQAGKQLPLIIGYAVCLCLMTACTLAGGFSLFSVAGWLMAAGGALFFVSDCLIGVRAFLVTRRALDFVIMLFYYSGLLCAGISCLF